MIENITFQIGNIIADASIAAFALILFLSERQRKRGNRVLSLLLASSAITDRQTAVIDALLDIGDEKSLEKYIKANTQIKGTELEKFKIVQRNLRLLHFSNKITLIAFALGILIEAMAVMQYIYLNTNASCLFTTLGVLQSYTF